MTIAKLIESMCQHIAFAYLDGLCDVELEDDDELFADLTRAERADLQTEAVREAFRDFALAELSEIAEARKLLRRTIVSELAQPAAPWKTSVAKTTATNDLRLRRDC
jgi:hypothetical protein